MLPWIPVHVLTEVFGLLTTEHVPFVRFGASALGILLGAFVLYASLPERSS